MATDSELRLIPEDNSSGYSSHGRYLGLPPGCTCCYLSARFRVHLQPQPLCFPNVLRANVRGEPPALLLLLLLLLQAAAPRTHRGHLKPAYPLLLEWSSTWISGTVVSPLHWKPGQYWTLLGFLYRQTYGKGCLPLFSPFLLKQSLMQLRMALNLVMYLKVTLSSSCL